MMIDSQTYRWSVGAAEVGPSFSSVREATAWARNRHVASTLHLVRHASESTEAFAPRAGEQLQLNLPAAGQGERPNPFGFQAFSSEPTPAPVRRPVTEDGFYYHDGAAYKVQVAVHGSGRLYAKLFDVESGTWEYAAGAIKKLSADEKMTLSQARAIADEFSQLYGTCFICGKTLTDETSIEIGMGPVCRAKFA